MIDRATKGTLGTGLTRATKGIIRQVKELLGVGDVLQIILSVKEHVKKALSDAGWSDTGKWVKLGSIQPETRIPAVAVSCTEMHRITYESGGAKRSVRAYIDVEIRGRNEPEIEEIKDTIEKNVDNMPIIDFDIAMPGDPGYDATAQTVAWGNTHNIKGRVVDAIDFTARVFFTLVLDRPI